MMKFMIGSSINRWDRWSDISRSRTKYRIMVQQFSGSYAGVSEWEVVILLGK